MIDITRGPTVGLLAFLTLGLAGCAGDNEEDDGRPQETTETTTRTGGVEVSASAGGDSPALGVLGVAGSLGLGAFWFARRRRA